MEEGDTCRICRTGAEDDVPLYHPCKCSGSIAKVHQDCLIEWLQHSKKKSCELCNTELRFHKVYSAAMPKTLPTRLYLRRLLLQSFGFFRLAVRALFVATAWLAVLPLGNIYIWRLHFWIVDVLIWGITGGQPPSVSSSSRSADLMGGRLSYDGRANATGSLWSTAGLSNESAGSTSMLDSPTSLATNGTTQSSTNGTSIGIPFPLLPFEKILVRFFSHNDYRKTFDSLAHDTFEGQILTCAVVVLFVALFLLREWCLQNLPQQVDALDIQPAPQLADALEAAPAQILPPPPPFDAPLNDDEAELRRRIREMVQPINDAALMNWAAEDQLRDTMEQRNGVQFDAVEERQSANLYDEQRTELPSLDDLRARRAQRFNHITETDRTGSSSDHLAAFDASQTEKTELITGEGDREVNEEQQADVGGSSLLSPLSATEKGKGRAFDETDEDTTEDVRGEEEAVATQLGADEESGFEAGFSEDDKGKPLPVELPSGEEQHAPYVAPGAASEDADKGSDISDSAILDEEDDEEDDEENEDDDDDEEEGEVNGAVEHLEGAVFDEEMEGALRAALDANANHDPAADALNAIAIEAARAQAARQANDNRREVAEARLADELGAGAGGDWEDEGENGERLEDDLEGMMEAIGMRGPFANLITNMTMMFVLCSFILTVFIALPYMMGRLVGVGHNVARLILLPLRLVRLVTDPLVDRLVDAMRSVWFTVKPGMMERMSKFTIARWPMPGISGSLDSQARDGVVGSLQRMLLNRMHSRPQAVIANHQASLNSFDALYINILSMRASALSSWRVLFAFLRQTLSSMEAKTAATTNADRAFCVALGHFYWLVGLAVQTKMANVYVRWGLKSLKTFVEQQLVVLKVLAFIVLELIVFPLCCGILTDISLFPLWQDATISSRIAIWQSKPLSVSFTLWSLGTLYMFALAQFVAHTRSIVRTGVLCFVRDAGDPNFHPIKDILERRSLEQLRKIGISGLIYSAILFVTVGFCARLVKATTYGVLPLNWQVHRSMSSVGFELVAIAVLLPIAIKAWFPAHCVRRFTRKWWRWIAKRLRISSYLIGGRFPNEEGRYVSPTWTAWMQDQLVTLGLMANAPTPASSSTGPNSSSDAARMAGSSGKGKRKLPADEHGADVQRRVKVFVPSGGHARVPADDQAIMTTPLVIRTNAKGEPISARGKEALRVQEEAIEKLTKKPQYTVVYLPPHFHLRIITLIVLLWGTLCALIITGFLPPLLVGRSILSLTGLQRIALESDAASQTGQKGIHDGYAWCIGFAVLGATHTLGAKAQRMFLKLRTSSNAPRRFGKHLRRFMQRCWLVFLFGFVTSTMLGACVEMYVSALTRVFVGSARLPTISLLHAWSTGILEQQLVFEILRARLGRTFRPNFDERKNAFWSGPFYALLELQNGGWRRPKARILTRHAFLPAFALHVCIIAVPLFLVRLIRLLDHQTSERAKSIQVSLVFLLCLGYVSSGLITRLIARRMDSWTDLIKDEHFLISTELKNYAANEEEAVQEADASGTDAKENGDAAVADVNAAATEEEDDRLRLVAEGPIPDALLHG